MSYNLQRREQYSVSPSQLVKASWPILTKKKEKKRERKQPDLFGVLNDKFLDLDFRFWISAEFVTSFSLGSRAVNLNFPGFLSKYRIDVFGWFDPTVKWTPRTVSVGKSTASALQLAADYYYFFFPQSGASLLSRRYATEQGTPFFLHRICTPRT